MTSFRINVTKEIIRRCRHVGPLDDVNAVGNVCPVALAVKHIFPEVYVGNQYLLPFGMNHEEKILLPEIAQDFVTLFDSLCMMPNVRLLIPAFEFDLEIPDEVIEKIDIRSCLEPVAVKGHVVPAVAGR